MNCTQTFIGCKNGFVFGELAPPNLQRILNRGSLKALEQEMQSDRHSIRSFDQYKIFEQGMGVAARQAGTSESADFWVLYAPNSLGLTENEPGPYSLTNPTGGWI